MKMMNFALTTFMAIFAIMNPFANIPIFMGLAAEESVNEQKRIARKAVVTAFIIGAAFILFGSYIFQFFHLTIPGFKIAGGVLLFYVGFEMLQSHASNIHSAHKHATDDGIAVSPLAIPILAGPGTIVTVMNASERVSFVHMVIVVLCYVLVLLLNYLAFVNSDNLTRIMGDGIIKVIGKVMGLVLTIIGVNMVIEGIKIGFNM
ncbi:NAAT family transporter [Puteibacter caeruleilacunae]|nr:NAAT family transporter [Puteibacter caeruleilacunae]